MEQSEVNVWKSTMKQREERLSLKEQGKGPK